VLLVVVVLLLVVVVVLGDCDREKNGLLAVVVVDRLLGDDLLFLFVFLTL